MSADVVVIGGGPHGLAVLAALAARPEPWPDRVVVVDPHEGWASAWDDKLARLALDRLRSPQVHHPGPRPMELRDLVEALPEEQQLAMRRHEDERVPTPAGMRALVDALAATLGPVEWIVGRAAWIELGAHEDLLDGGAGRAVDGDATVRVQLADGRGLLARHVVLAHNPSTPRVPEWAEPLVEAGVAVHASAIDLREEPVAARHVAIVGGGLTAGSLALEVTARGGRVTLLTRRPLRARPYDVDASWLGPRRLAEYLAAGSSERRQLIDVARDGGTMPPRVLEELRARAAEPGSGLVILEAVDVPTELGVLLTEAELEDGTLVAELAARAAAATDLVHEFEARQPEAAAYVDNDGPWDVAPAIDAVWLATGFANDVLADDLVAPLVEALGVPVHGGLPEVSESLSLGRAPVHVAGPYAALGVGPASRNLAGARPAAARIAAALVG